MKRPPQTQLHGGRPVALGAMVPSEAKNRGGKLAWSFMPEIVNVRRHCEPACGTVTDWVNSKTAASRSS